MDPHILRQEQMMPVHLQKQGELMHESYVTASAGNDDVSVTAESVSLKTPSLPVTDMGTMHYFDVKNQSDIFVAFMDQCDACVPGSPCLVPVTNNIMFPTAATIRLGAEDSSVQISG